MAANEDKDRAKAASLAEKGEALPVELRVHDGRTTQGTLRRYALSAAERGKRARTWLFTFVGLSPLAAVVPPHFPWLLSMIALGIAGSYARGRAHELILGGEGTCPACGAFQLLDGGAPEFPMAHFCSACKARSLVTPVAAAASS